MGRLTVRSTPAHPARGPQRTAHSRELVWQPGLVTDEIGTQLSDDELRTLIRLLARYCNHDLDQWDNWRLTLPWGEVFVSIFNGLPPDHPRDAYAQVWPYPPRLMPQADTDRDE